MFPYDDSGLTLTIFMTGLNLSNASAWVKSYTALSANVYFQVCFNSAYPPHSGERYWTNGHLVKILL